MSFCPQCGFPCPEEALFCGECGFNLSTPAPEENATASDEPVSTSEEALPEHPPKRKKTWIFITVACLCLAAMAVGIWFFLQQPKLKNYGLYIKDSNIFYTDFSEKGSFDTGIFSNFSRTRTIISENSALSRDGKILFLTETAAESRQYPFTLYYRKVDDPNGKPVEIGDDLMSYAISDDGMTVFCHTASVFDQDDYLEELPQLYLYNLKTGKTQSIAEDVMDFFPSADGQKCVYTVYDRQTGKKTLFYWNHDGTNKKVHEQSNTNLLFYTEDLSNIYYEIRNSSDGVSGFEIYRYQPDTHTKKRISATGRFLTVYDTGAYYYHDIETDEVYFFDGEKSTCVSDHYYAMNDLSNRTPILAIMSKEKTIIDYIIVENRATAIDPIKGRALIAPDGSACYIVESDTGKLFRYPISGKQVGDRELVDEGIDPTVDLSYERYFLTDNRLLYIKNPNTETQTATLCVDGETMAEAVHYPTVRCAGGILMYYTDYNSDSEAGTLHVFRDGKITQVAGDVHDYILTPEKDILYLTDYSIKDHMGTLYFYDWESGKSQVNATDVTAIAYVNPGRIRGHHYHNNFYCLDYLKATNYRYWNVTDNWCKLWIDHNH